MTTAACSLLLANVRSLKNKMERRTRERFQQETSVVLSFLQKPGLLQVCRTQPSIYRPTPHTVETTHLSTNKGEGVSVYVNERWCVDIQVVEIVEQTSKVQTFLFTEGLQCCVYTSCLHPAVA